MKHFYTISIAIFAMFSTQLLFAQAGPSTENSEANGLIASRTNFSSSVIDLNYRNELLNESHTGQARNKSENLVENKTTNFSNITSGNANGFEANFNAPKSGKAELSIRAITGQVIYKENIDIIKGSNSHVIKSQQMNNGMYLVSITNDQVNYNGKMQK